MGRMVLCTARLTTCLWMAMTAVGMVLAQNEELRPPNIKKPLTSVLMYERENTKVTVDCVADGIPPPKYTWYVDNESGEPVLIIPGEEVTYNTSTGKLTIGSIGHGQVGNYSCRATNSFRISTGLNISATTVSPKIDIRLSYLEDWPKVTDWTGPKGTEHQYYSLRCDHHRPKYSGRVEFKWFRRSTDVQTPVVEDDRTFIDKEGTLHFTNLIKTDAPPLRYSCGLSNADTGKIVAGAKVNFVFDKSEGANEVPAVLQYPNDTERQKPLTFIKGRDARLECVFSGYPTPNVVWEDSASNKIVNGGQDGHFSIESNGRVLIIHNVDENDETPFYCRTRKGDGEKGMLNVDITSPPIWVDRLRSETVPEGRDAVFHCKTRSLTGERPPDRPVWYRNMDPLTTDQGGEGPKKHVLSQDGQRLTVRDVKKSDDIACYQCFVRNHVGVTFGDGCLNVLLPIQITERPREQIVVSKGDVVNLTVLATSDPLYPLTYDWVFKNRTYRTKEAPPLVDYNPVTRVAFINTSRLNDTQMNNISGLYTITVFHSYQAVNVTVKLVLESVYGPAAAGFPFWIIGLIIAILIIILVIILCCCVICRRKMQEGDYPVDRKETAAGLDPEKEVKEGGFPDLSRAQDPNHNKKASHLELDGLSDGDASSFGGTEYGDEPGAAFNEDGSFIAAYHGKDKRPVMNPAFQPVQPSDNPAFNPNESAV